MLADLGRRVSREVLLKGSLGSTPYAQGAEAFPRTICEATEASPPLPKVLRVDGGEHAEIVRVDTRRRPPRKCRRDPLGTLVHQVCCRMRPSRRNDHGSHLTLPSADEADCPPRALLGLKPSQALSCAETRVGETGDARSKVAFAGGLETASNRPGGRQEGFVRASHRDCAGEAP